MNSNNVFFFLPDVAVGAPYGGRDQQGVVLIYNGHAGGLMDTPTQTLSGQWASSAFPAAFGFALRGNRDLDQNGYPGTRVGPLPVSSSLAWCRFPLRYILKVQLYFQI